ncbi:putative WD repeat-containing protein [Lachnellula subtilissima]|uniref:Putative WD repeat-containing protein n=1 Tax=Lachnellula subtilissima TaxID=602034 RepID=A0A8H8U599_9HELO|nr:putative WD repeat-containing protein [Lachnellula subtilissima]
MTAIHSKLWDSHNNGSYLASPSRSAFPSKLSSLIGKHRRDKTSRESIVHSRCLSLSIGQRYDGPSDDKKRTVSAGTFPRIKASSFFRRRPILKTFDSSSTQVFGGSLRSPDRFVCSRRVTVDSFIESFRINKDPSSLTPEERLLRNKDASPDAFNARRNVNSPSRPNRNPPSLPRRNFSPNRSGGGGASVLTFHREPPSQNGERQVSVGTVWTVGGLAPFSTGVPNGRGGLLGSGTNAPLYTTPFSNARPKAQEEMEKHEGRLAEALEIDRSTRVLEFRDPTILPSRLGEHERNKAFEHEGKTLWNGTEWVITTVDQRPLITKEARTLPLAPFKVLDAPNLRDDFYCSVLAYSATCHTLAVGLGTLLYAWSEMQGVHLLHTGTQNGSHLTSLAFSSAQGGKSILAFGKSDGSLSLMSLYDSMIPRFELPQPSPVACVTWRPVTTMRPSKCPITPGVLVQTEDLLVGDESGLVQYYSVEWPDAWEVTRGSWSGSVTLLARITIHTQQICGLSFNPDGTLLGTGGNDNLCCLFQTRSILDSVQDHNDNAEELFTGADGIRRVRSPAPGDRNTVKEIVVGAEKHRWVHGAAVKAIAFCPWRDGLVATSGGSNDKCIHFFHTSSGACLATISVSAQVTSLIWSTTRREIAATFGYAQPEHPYRIAVFSWPDCKQEGEHRALYAIPYPGGPNESQTSREGGRGLTRTAQEGCIVVACSDESVKFHEVWTASQKATAGGEGLLGGSDILEGLEGIDKEGEVIR